MKLINIGDKIVSIGTTVLMPGNEMTITVDQAKLPAIGALIAKKFVKVEDEPAWVKPTEEKAIATEEPAEETAAEKKVTTTEKGRKRGLSKVTKEE